MKSLITFKELIDNELNKLTFPSKPANLYDPIKYILSLEAKRMRSIALLLSHNSFNENYTPKFNIVSTSIKSSTNTRSR